MVGVSLQKIIPLCGLTYKSSLSYRLGPSMAMAGVLNLEYVKELYYI